MKAATQAAEAVRALIHLTQGRDGYREPADVAEVLADLVLLLDRLPQALDQAREYLARELAAGRLRHDELPMEEDVRTEFADLAASLHEVVIPIGEAASLLNAARGIASHLAGGAR